MNGFGASNVELWRSTVWRIAEHDTNIHREEYEAALQFIEKHAALWSAEVSLSHSNPGIPL
jgi:hypothetical protein